MKLVQVYTPDGGIRAGLVRGEEVVDLALDRRGLRTVLDYVRAADEQNVPLHAAVEAVLGEVSGKTYRYTALDRAPDPQQPYLMVPISPPEVWACGVTYRPSADFRDQDMLTSSGIYGMVYTAPRPEIFFKGTASRCTGPNDFVGLRGDSSFTATEPELALVLGRCGQIFGYTAANDVSAWDIERENPLYLPQSKVFAGCCALGPVVVTADEIHKPYQLDIACRVLRNGKIYFEGHTNTQSMKRTFDELIRYLYYGNPIPSGTVMLTGTGIILPAERPHAVDDVVEITIESIGTLRNYFKSLQPGAFSKRELD